MRKTIVMAAVAACMFVSNVFAQRIKGSDTCLPLSQTEAENFINKINRKDNRDGRRLRAWYLSPDGRDNRYRHVFP